MQNPPIRRFTGWHITGILVAFFCVVIAVNMLMATIAVRSFGGTVVDNSYVASQEFNQWLARARAQDRLGWRDQVVADEQRHPLLTIVDASGIPIDGAQVQAVAQHPLGRAPDVALRFEPIAPGRYRSESALPAGRWKMAFTIRHDGGEQRLLREID
jgi:nitrogen fixation protein FixH